MLTARAYFGRSYAGFLESPDVQRIEVSLNEVEYVDSSALGMFLLLKEKALAARKDIYLCNPMGEVNQILKKVCFEKIFTIEGLNVDGST